MAIELKDKPAVSTIGDSDTILVVKSTGEVRRITKADLAAIMNPLPTVTAADNGKVLAVVNGAWAATSIDNVISAAAGVSF